MVAGSGRNPKRRTHSSDQNPVYGSSRTTKCQPSTSYATNKLRNEGGKVIIAGAIPRHYGTIPYHNWYHHTFVREDLARNTLVWRGNGALRFCIGGGMVPEDLSSFTN